MKKEVGDQGCTDHTIKLHCHVSTGSQGLTSCYSPGIMEAISATDVQVMPCSGRVGNTEIPNWIMQMSTNTF